MSESRYIPYSEEKKEITACGSPVSYNASKEFANKKVVLFSVPGIPLDIIAVSKSTILEGVACLLTVVL